MKSSLKIYDDFPQNSPPWDHLRLGKLTASNFKVVLRQGRSGSASKTRDRAVHDIAYELMTGLVSDTKWNGNAYTERGKEQEQEALELYMALKGLEDKDVSRPAFVWNEDGRCGCSPDALIGEDGGLEIKTMAGGMFSQLMMDPQVPPAHMPQVQGSLLITGRKFWDVLIYTRGMDPLLRRVLPDAEYQRELRDGIRAFNKEVESVVLKHTGETVLTRQRILDERLEEIVQEYKSAAEGGSDD